MIEISRDGKQVLLDLYNLWVQEGLFTWETGREIIVVLIGLLLAFVLARLLPGLVLPRLRQHWRENSLRFSLAEKISRSALPLLAALILEVIAASYYWEFSRSHILTLSAKLAWTWLLVRLVTSFLARGLTSRIFVLIIWAMLVLEILGLLAPLAQFLDGFGLQTDNFRISLLSLLKGAFIAALLLLFIGHICRYLEENLPQSSRFSPRAQILVIKTTKLVLYTLAVVIALDSVGLDFYLVSIFSGALGLGLGFGLQRVVANLFAGFVILLDSSIRPGDVIELEGLFGWVETLQSRFVRLLTRDGKSYLIPNEYFINHKVVNWSFGAPEVRVKVPLGISYGADIHLAMKLMVEAAMKRSRVLGYPKPVSRLMGFGHSAINLELRFWMKDPQNGVTNLCSDIQLDIWEAFQANGISFPFPQRDVHLKGGPQVTVVVREEPPPEEAEPTPSTNAGSNQSPAPAPPGAGPPPRRSAPGSAAGE